MHRSDKLSAFGEVPQRFAIVAIPKHDPCCDVVAEGCVLRVFKTRSFARFARREGIEDISLIDAIRRAEQGLIQAELGGGLIKQRVSRSGGGRSGGYRTIVAYRRDHRAYFLYGFAKNDRANVGRNQLLTLKELAIALLVANDGQVASLSANGDLEELLYE